MTGIAVELSDGSVTSMAAISQLAPTEPNEMVREDSQGKLTIYAVLETSINFLNHFPS